MPHPYPLKKKKKKEIGKKEKKVKKEKNGDWSDVAEGMGRLLDAEGNPSKRETNPG